MSVDGFNIIGYSRGEAGVGEMPRSLARAFALTNIPFGLLYYKYGTPERDLDDSTIEYEIPRPLYNKTIFAMNPENAQSIVKHLEGPILKRAHKVIAYWVWELGKLPDWWLPAIALVDEIWVPSEFIRKVMKQYTRLPVHVVPLAVGTFSPAKPISRRKLNLGISKESFVFFTNADPLSCLDRKNPLGVVLAFKRAFPKPGDKRVHLIVKTKASSENEPHFEELKRQIKGWGNISLISHWMRRETLEVLLDRVDCYVSLHRAEGFGLMPAEFMARGKPVIVTRWSGVTQFARPENSFMVDYKLVPVGIQFGFYYSPEQIWAEPDLNQAARHMVRLESNRKLGQKVGKRARKTIESEFSVSAIAEQILTLVKNH